MRSQKNILSTTYNETRVSCARFRFVRFAAPTGCLQYHTSLSGTIQSFNYAGGMYQSGLDYAICIKRSVNTCRVEFQQVSGSVFGINSMEGQYEPELLPNSETGCFITLFILAIFLFSNRRHCRRAIV